MSYEQIADILDVTPAGARQLLHRARHRVAAGHRERFTPDPETHGRLLESFLEAFTSGDLDGLRNLLSAYAVAYADGGGKARAIARPVVGADAIVRAMAPLVARTSGADVRSVEANGGPATLLRVGDQDELLTIGVHDGKISAVFGVLNPDKLRYVFAQLAAGT